jgi:hypothetical protein
MSKTREGQQLVLEGTAYDNFINAVRSKSSQKFYLVGLKKFMAYNRLQKVSEMLVWDQRLIEAKIISWLVNMRDKESLTYITIQSYLSAVMTFYKMNDIEPRRHKINTNNQLDNTSLLHLVTQLYAFINCIFSSAPI